MESSNLETYEIKRYDSGMTWTGLAATVWDPSGGDGEQPDQATIQKLIEAHPGPALDVGCGTGRLLLRYLKAGLDVDGVEPSADMLEICREKGLAQGLKPALYQQAMQDLDLPRQYRVIYIPCGTFCLITDRQQAMEALVRIYAHLQPGGLLVFNLFWPFNEHAPLTATAVGQNGEWSPMWTNTLPDGSQVAQFYKLIHVDRVEQVMNAHRRYQLARDGQVEQEEVFAADERWYFKHEMVMMLEKTGFQNIQVKGNWTDDDFTDPPHHSMVFIAHKETTP